MLAEKHKYITHMGIRRNYNEGYSHFIHNKAIKALPVCSVRSGLIGSVDFLKKLASTVLALQHKHGGTRAGTCTYVCGHVDVEVTHTSVKILKRHM